MKHKGAGDLALGDKQPPGKANALCFLLNFSQVPGTKRDAKRAPHLMLTTTLGSRQQCSCFDTEETSVSRNKGTHPRPLIWEGVESGLPPRPVPLDLRVSCLSETIAPARWQQSGQPPPHSGANALGRKTGSYRTRKTRRDIRLELVLITNFWTLEAMTAAGRYSCVRFPRVQGIVPSMWNTGNSLQGELDLSQESIKIKVESSLSSENGLH